METNLISLIIDQIESHNSACSTLELGPGDDAAILKVPQGGRVVVSTDSSIENVHFDQKFMSPAQIGFRATTGAMSDIAAMAANPLSINLALTLPKKRPGFDHNQWLTEFYSGVLRCLQGTGVSISGGNLARLPEEQNAPITIDITAMGTLSAEEPVPTRGGAAPGDTLAISGPVGWSALGLRLLREDPEALALAEGFEIQQVDAMMQAFLEPKARFDLIPALRLADSCTSLIDISDGLSRELRLLAAASKCGFVISWHQFSKVVEPLQLPHPKKMFDFEDSFIPFLIYGGGEDYQLLGTFDGDVPAGFTPIGYATEDVGEIVMESAELSLHTIPPLGYDHFG